MNRELPPTLPDSTAAVQAETIRNQSTKQPIPVFTSFSEAVRGASWVVGSGNRLVRQLVEKQRKLNQICLQLHHVQEENLQLRDHVIQLHRTVSSQAEELSRMRSNQQMSTANDPSRNERAGFSGELDLVASPLAPQSNTSASLAREHGSLAGVQRKPKKGGCFRVAVRIRPKSDNSAVQSQETHYVVSKAKSNAGCPTPDCYRLQIAGDKSTRSFWYDAVFEPDAQQDPLLSTASPLRMAEPTSGTDDGSDEVATWILVALGMRDDSSESLRSSLPEAGIATFCLYGATGSGKTHTWNSVMPKVMVWLFSATPSQQAASQPGSSSTRHGSHARYERTSEDQEEVDFSAVEIYKEKAYCLVSKDITNSSANRVTEHECDITDFPFADTKPKGNRSKSYPAIATCSSEQQLRRLLEKATVRRHVRDTGANSVSSRGHGIFAFRRRERVFLVADLAGNERADRVHSSDDELQDMTAERKAINQGLSALGNVFRSFAKKDAVRPWRASPLCLCFRRAIEASALGDGKFAMLCTMASDKDLEGESIITAEFAEQVWRIREFGQESR